MIQIKVDGAKGTAADLVKIGVKTEVITVGLTRHFGKVMKQRAQSDAPRDTGKYAKTIRLNVTKVSKLGPKATVRSKAPQAHRLEMGWAGPDTWGRFYPMNAQPHLKPALDATAPEYVASIMAIPF